MVEYPWKEIIFQEYGIMTLIKGSFPNENNLSQFQKIRSQIFKMTEILAYFPRIVVCWKELGL